VNDTDWEFVVEVAMTITGRGTAVDGTLTGHRELGVGPADMWVDGTARRIDRVSLEFFLKKGGEESPGLLLLDVPKEDVPKGATIRPPRGP